ncbi:helix-turn-helix domain-containing protein [Paenibacillus sp. YPG26]|uniref:helix-turn-helix domain-containing protein n=1 Tax=Paenibacillus sp. YPG26 TaxID=2878915 RepID=UPI002040D7F8|nr:helix-turn-helix domain-containing protein [Paenibacillus sp. YPG26]USB32538.1 hypothetical protein LDO05_14710 [Paenibacillus sp. YPG26]
MKFKTYTLETELEAIRMNVEMGSICHLYPSKEEKWTYRQITDKLGIQEKDRVKKWMRKYRQQGNYGLLDQL